MPFMPASTMAPATRKHVTLFTIGLYLAVVVVVGVMYATSAREPDFDAWFDYQLQLTRVFLAATGLVGAALLWLHRAWAGRCVRELLMHPRHPRNLAVMRIAVCVLMFKVFASDIGLFYAALPLELQVPPQTGVPGWPFIWRFYNWPALPFDPTAVRVAMFVGQCACVLGAIGLFSRTMLWTICVAGLYVLALPQWFAKVDHGFLPLLSFAALAGAARCGDALSVDAIVRALRRAGRAGQTQPPGPSSAYGLPIALAWVFMGVVYLFPGFWKVASVGLYWPSVENFQCILYLKWFELGGVFPPLRLDQYPVLLVLGGVSTVVWEIVFVFMVFLPRGKWLVVFTGLIFHNLSKHTLQIGFGALLKMYVIFFDWHAIVTWLGRRLFRSDMVLVYDGGCRLCRKTIATLRVFDVFERVTYVNALDDSAVRELVPESIGHDALMRDMHALVGGNVFRGYDAYRALAYRMPLLWVTLPLLYLWPVTTIGRRVYRRVADGRTCQMPTASSQGTEPTIMPRVAMWPVAAVGCAIIATHLWCGAFKYGQAYPWTCYPTFAHYGHLSELKAARLDIEIESAGGALHVADVEPCRKRFGSRRWEMLIGRTLRLKDEDLRRRRLRLIWDVMQQLVPDLPPAHAVRFYYRHYWADPPRWADPPFEIQLVYEWRPDTIKANPDPQP